MTTTSINGPNFRVIQYEANALIAAAKKSKDGSYRDHHKFVTDITPDLNRIYARLKEFKGRWFSGLGYANDYIKQFEKDAEAYGLFRTGKAVVEDVNSHVFRKIESNRRSVLGKNHRLSPKEYGNFFRNVKHVEVKPDVPDVPDVIASSGKPAYSIKVNVSKGNEGYIPVTDWEGEIAYYRLPFLQKSQYEDEFADVLKKNKKRSVRDLYMHLIDERFYTENVRGVTYEKAYSAIEKEIGDQSLGDIKGLEDNKRFKEYIEERKIQLDDLLPEVVRVLEKKIRFDEKVLWFLGVNQRVLKKTGMGDVSPSVNVDVPLKYQNPSAVMRIKDLQSWNMTSKKVAHIPVKSIYSFEKSAHTITVYDENGNSTVLDSPHIDLTKGPVTHENSKDTILFRHFFGKRNYSFRSPHEWNDVVRDDNGIPLHANQNRKVEDIYLGMNRQKLGEYVKLRPVAIGVENYLNERGAIKSEYYAPIRDGMFCWRIDEITFPDLKGASTPYLHLVDDYLNRGQDYPSLDYNILKQEVGRNTELLPTLRSSYISDPKQHIYTVEGGKIRAREFGVHINKWRPEGQKFMKEHAPDPDPNAGAIVTKDPAAGIKPYVFPDKIESAKELADVVSGSLNYAGKIYNARYDRIENDIRVMNKRLSDQINDMFRKYGKRKRSNSAPLPIISRDFFAHKLKNLPVKYLDY